MPKNPPSNAPEFLEHLETSPIEISATDLGHFVRWLLVKLNLAKHKRDLDKRTAKVHAAAEETSKTDVVMVLAIITGSIISCIFSINKISIFCQI